MPTTRVEFDPDWAREYASSWDSPLGEQLISLTEDVNSVAHVLVPISAIGSRYAPPGYLSSRLSTFYDFSDDGTILSGVGIPKAGANGNRYPYPFINSASGTRQIRNGYSLGARHFNPRRRPPHGFMYGQMFANNAFLFESLSSVFPTSSIF